MNIPTLLQSRQISHPKSSANLSENSRKVLVPYSASSSHLNSLEDFGDKLPILKESGYIKSIQLAATDPAKSVLVLASAGSGKTKLLIDRISRLLLNGCLPQKILALTFTNVAALEMKNRVASELSSWAMMDDAALSAKLADLTGKTPTFDKLTQARTLFDTILRADNSLRIQTIHSLASDLLRSFPYEAGVDPDFEILDENQARLLFDKARSAALADVNYREIIKALNLKLGEENLAELLLGMLRKRNKFDEDAINFAALLFRVDLNQSEEEVAAEFVGQIDFAKLARVAAVLQESSSKTDQQTAQAFNQFVAAKNVEILRPVLLTKTDEARSKIITKKFAPYQEILQQINEIQQQLLSYRDKIKSKQILANSASLLALARSVINHYQQLKGKNLDYIDLIERARFLLLASPQRDWVRYKLNGSVDHILVDEAQDTNCEQWEIITVLCEDFFSQNSNRTIFIVGDKKQSIYGFQGAEPDAAENAFDEISKNANAENFIKLKLNYSYRFVKTIADAVNSVFKNFDPHESLRVGEGRIELWPRVVPEPSLENMDEPDDAERLAQNIAFKIKSWVAEKRIITAHNRAVNYGDIMILLRNRTNGLDAALMKALTLEQIPFSGINQMRVLDSLICLDLLAIAKFALLPCDDFNLACLLKSPLFKTSEEELLNLCVIKNENQISLFAAIERSERKQLLIQLSEIIEKSKQLTAFEFFYYFQSKLATNSHALEFLDQFILEISALCSRLINPSLQQLVSEIEKNNPLAVVANNDTNQVLISTIHGAKGLQAPIVIIADAYFEFGKIPVLNQKVHWISSSSILTPSAIPAKAGIQTSIPIWCAKKIEENNFLRTHKLSELKKAQAEYERLLYVAMTRAEDELYFTGFGSSDGKSWGEAISGFLKPISIEKTSVREKALA